jgi:pyruvate dehydrogenase kinase 2/3/4
VLAAPIEVDETIIKELSNQQQVSVSLRSMIDTGTGKYLPPSATSEDVMVQVATFLHKEMPVRMAHRIVELDTLPHGLCDMPSVKLMRGWYMQSLSELLENEVPPKTYEDEESFKKVMHGIYERHNDTLLTTARSLYEFKKSGTMDEAIAISESKNQQKRSQGGKYKKKTGFGNAGGSTVPGIGQELADLPALHEALDQFLMCRMGIRTLIGQYLALHPEPTAKLMQFRHLRNASGEAANSFTEPANVLDLDDDLADVGMICMRTQPAAIAANAAADATDIFERQLPDFDAPEVKIIDPSNCMMAFIPSHLYYILFELIKNSMRATAEVGQ